MRQHSRCTRRPSPSAAPACALGRADRGGARHAAGDRVRCRSGRRSRACRRYVVSFTRSAADLAAVYELAEPPLGGRGAPVLDVVPLFETGEDLAAAPAVLDEMLDAARRCSARLAETGRRLEVMLGYSDSAKDVGPVAGDPALYDAQDRARGVGRRARHRADAVPRPRRRARPRRRPGQPGDPRPAAGLGGRAVQGDRAGRGHLRPLRQPRDRRCATSSRSPRPCCSPPTPAVEQRNAEAAAALRRAGRHDRATPRERRSARWSRPTASPTGSPRSARWRSSASCARLAARPRRGLATPSLDGPAGDPVGVRLDADACQPARLVRPGQRPRGGGREAGPRRAARRRTARGRCSPRCSTTPR